MPGKILTFLTSVNILPVFYSRLFNREVHYTSTPSALLSSKGKHDVRQKVYTELPDGLLKLTKPEIEQVELPS